MIPCEVELRSSFLAAFFKPNFIHAVQLRISDLYTLFVDEGTVVQSTCCSRRSKANQF